MSTGSTGATGRSANGTATVPAEAMDGAQFRALLMNAPGRMNPHGTPEPRTESSPARCHRVTGSPARSEIPSTDSFTRYSTPASEAACAAIWSWRGPSGPPVSRKTRRVPARAALTLAGSLKSAAHGSAPAGKEARSGWRDMARTGAPRAARSLVRAPPTVPVAPVTRNTGVSGMSFSFTGDLGTGVPQPLVPAHLGAQSADLVLAHRALGLAQPWQCRRQPAFRRGQLAIEFQQPGLDDLAQGLLGDRAGMRERQVERVVAQHNGAQHLIAQGLQRPAPVRGDFVHRPLGIVTLPLGPRRGDQALAFEAGQDSVQRARLDVCPLLGPVLGCLQPHLMAVHRPPLSQRGQHEQPRYTHASTLVRVLVRVKSSEGGYR